MAREIRHQRMQNRYAMLVVVLVVGAGLDQWSKHWASENLGTAEHPLPVHVSAADSGKRLGDVVQNHFDLRDAEISAIFPEAGPTSVSLLATGAPMDGTMPAFPTINGQPRIRYYWVFLDPSLRKPPRRLPQSHRQAEDLADYGSSTLAEYVTGAIGFLSADQTANVLSGSVFAVVHSPMREDRTVREGEIYLLLRRPVSVISGFFQFSYAENPGAAWGILSTQSETFRRWFFMIISLLAVSVMSAMYYRLKPHQNMAALGFATILSGALGNFIDRIRFNHVIDFIDMYVGKNHWPTYNIADVAISVGVGLLLLEVLIKRDQAFLTAHRPPRQGAT